MQYYVSQASRISLQIAFTLTLLITSSCGEEQITNSQQPNADQDPQALLALTGISGSCSGLRALDGSNAYYRYATIYDYDTCFIDPPMARARGWSNDGYFKVDFCAGPSGNIVEATNWYAQSSSYAVGRPYTANFGTSSSPTWKSLATNAGCGNADGRRVYVELTGQLPPPPTPPSPTRCTLSVTSGTVNGKIPQAGGVVSFAVTPSGGTVRGLSANDPTNVQVLQPLDRLSFSISANNSRSERGLSFEAIVRDSSGRTASCVRFALSQEASSSTSPTPPNPPTPPSCSLSVTSGTVNQKIPQAGADLSFAVTSSSGATVRALSVSPSSARVRTSLNPLRMTVNANSGTSERPLAFQATVSDSSGQTGSCGFFLVQQAAPMQCPVVSVPTCSAPGGGGCTSVSEGQEAVVAVQVQALSSGLRNFVNTMRGTEIIPYSSANRNAFEQATRELPGVQMSDIRITQRQQTFRSIEFGDLRNKVVIFFEMKRGPLGFGWYPITWNGRHWRPDLNINQKNDLLISMRTIPSDFMYTESFLTVLESLAFAFPGVYGTNELINGGSGGARVLGATSLVADLATFGMGSGLRIMGRTVASASSCRAVVLTGAAARITNAAVNPSLGTGIDAALASVDVGSIVGVQFVRVIIRNGKGFIKSSSPRSGAQAIASSLGKRLDEIVEGGQGIPLDQLSRLGVKSGSASWKTFAGEFVEEVRVWSDSIELSVFAEHNGSRIGQFTGNTIYSASREASLGTVRVFGDANTCRFGLNGTQLYQSVFSHSSFKQNPGTWKVSSYFAEDNKRAFECAYDAALAAGKSASEASVAGTRATQEYKIMVERLGAQISKFPPSRDNLSIEYLVNVTPD